MTGVLSFISSRCLCMCVVETIACEGVCADESASPA